MTVWRINAVIVPENGNPLYLPEFYIDCLSADVEYRAIEIVGAGRSKCHINLTVGPLEKPRKSTANRYPTEGIYLPYLQCDDVLVYSEGI